MTQVSSEEELVEPLLAYDAADPKQVNNARKKAARIHQKRVNFVREMMSSQGGRLWVYDKLIMGHVAEPTFTPGDPHATSFKEGERNFANSLIADISEAAPEMYMKMMVEGKTEK